MTRKLFLFRPEPGWTQSAEAARATGLVVDGAPLFDVEPVPWDAPDSSGFDGLLIGSANVLRHGGPALGEFQHLPVYAVGKGTARAAGAAGFAVAAVGSGGLQPLLDELAGRSLRLLRLAGARRAALIPPPGIALEERAVYRAVPRPLDEALGQKLATGGVVALHSGEAARVLISEFDRLGIDRGRLALAVLAPRIAELAGAGWQSVYIAERPTDGELLVLARALCQTG